MASRLDLQTFLEEILESRNVYFQPPESVKMKYPAIVYALDDIENVHADNGVSIPTCRFERYYASENLNHWNFSLYF